VGFLISSSASSILSYLLQPFIHFLYIEMLWIVLDSSPLQQIIMLWVIFISEGLQEMVVLANSAAVLRRGQNACPSGKLEIVSQHICLPGNNAVALIINKELMQMVVIPVHDLLQDLMKLE